MACKSAGEPNSDISGLGVLTAILLQAVMSMGLSAITFMLDYEHNSDSWMKLMKLNSLRDISKESRINKLRWKLANRLLISAGEGQSLVALGLLFTALLGAKSMSLYHFHIIYDTVSIITITHTLSISRVSDETNGLNLKSPWVILIGSYLVLFATFIVTFGKELESWDDNIPGRCYSARYMSHPDTPHPNADKIYIAITSLYTILAFVIPFAIRRFQNRMIEQAQRREKAMGPSIEPQQQREMMLWTKTLLWFTVTSWPNVMMLLQLLVHLYSGVSLRISNAHLFEGGKDESEWGFGQISAVAMVTSNLLQCVNRYIEYRKKTEALCGEHDSSV